MITNLVNLLSLAVKKWPDNIALMDSEGELTYRQLAEKAKGVAHLIQQACKGEQGHPILIEAERDLRSVVLIWGVLLSGNFYVPIKHEMGQERINSVIDQVSPKCALVYSDKGRKACLGFEAIINISEVPSQLDYEHPVLISKDLAYVLFTSGSTGKPKGVCLSHGAVVDYIKWCQSEFQFADTDIFLNQAPFVFDNSVFDIFNCAYSGAKLYVPSDQECLVPTNMAELIRKLDATVIFWVPSILTMLSKLDRTEAESLASLRYIIFAGEVMPAQTLKYWQTKVPMAKFFNLYGPTEIAVDCTYFEVPEGWDGDDVPIGKACENMRVFCLDDHGREASKGEICVAGVGLAEGYWNNQMETEARFQSRPLLGRVERFYRTGDFGEEVDGLLYFKGRRDDQIKIRGHRVELQNIEQLAGAIKGVELAVFGFNSALQEIFCAYSGSKVEEKLRAELRDVLASYEIPKKVLKVQNMPRLMSGKVDRKKLEQLFYGE